MAATMTYLSYVQNPKQAMGTVFKYVFQGDFRDGKKTGR